MVSLYHISKDDKIGSHKKQSEFLKKACEDRGIEYLRFIEGDRSPLEYNAILPKETDLIYRSACGRWAKTLEGHFLMRGGKNIFTGLEPGAVGLGNSYHAMFRNNLPVVPSIEFIPKKKVDVSAVSQYLGGFPIIVKVSGGMEGKGIIRADGIESLNSILDYLQGDKNSEIRIMKYITHEYYARVVVVGDKVVAATSDVAPIGDFRTNARGPRSRTCQNIDLTQYSADISIQALKAIGRRAGGVDLLFSGNEEVYITEVNTPFNFAETQRVTGVDIAGALVDELLV